MGWAGLGSDGMQCIGCEGWSEGWGGTGFGMGAAGVLWMGFHGMGLFGWAATKEYIGGVEYVHCVVWPAVWWFVCL